jgi:hypothetical protein
MYYIICIAVGSITFDSGTDLHSSSFTYYYYNTAFFAAMDVNTWYNIYGLLASTFGLTDVSSVFLIILSPLPVGEYRWCSKRRWNLDSRSNCDHNAVAYHCWSGSRFFYITIMHHFLLLHRCSWQVQYRLTLVEFITRWWTNNYRKYTINTKCHNPNHWIYVYKYASTTAVGGYVIMKVAVEK